jgi:hypothetical protein
MQPQKALIQSAVTVARARLELNESMLYLRRLYGFAPPKGISQAAMKVRCDRLVNAVDNAVERYVEATGRVPDKMRNTSPYVVSKEFPARKNEGLASYANVPDDRLKKAPLHTLEATGNLMNFNADYLLKAQHEAAVKARTRREWQKAEYEYVEKSDYNLRDLYDDLMERMDATENYITPEQYREERRKWRQCRYYACDNYFPTEKAHMKSAAFNQSGIEARRKDARYCCDECKKDQENALERLKKTGTLLPDYAYEYILDDAREGRAEKEIAILQVKLDRLKEKTP